MLRALHVRSKGATRDLTRKGWRVAGYWWCWARLAGPPPTQRSGSETTWQDGREATYLVPRGKPPCLSQLSQTRISRFAQTWASEGMENVLWQRRRHGAEVSTTAPDRRRGWRRTSREGGRASGFQPEKKGKGEKKHRTRTLNSRAYLCDDGASGGPPRAPWSNFSKAPGRDAGRWKARAGCTYGSS